MDQNEKLATQENVPKTLEELQELSRSLGLEDLKVAKGFENLSTDRKQQIIESAFDFLNSLSEEEKNTFKLLTSNATKLKLSDNFEGELNDFKRSVAQIVEYERRGNVDSPPLEQNPSEPVVAPLNEPSQTETPEAETRGYSSEWNALESLLNSLGIALEYNEEHLTKFDETNPEKIKEKFNEIREAIESFPNKENLKEKFSAVRLGYPKHEEGVKVFLANDILFIDVSADRQEIVNFIETLVNPKEKEEEVLPTAEIPPTPAAPEKSELAPKIKKAESFDELYEILEESDGIQTPKGFYAASELVGYVRAIETDSNLKDSSYQNAFEEDMQRIPEEEGLREKVRELYNKNLTAIQAKKPEPEAELQQTAVPNNEPQPEIEKPEAEADDLKKDFLGLYPNIVFPPNFDTLPLNGKREWLRRWVKNEIGETQKTESVPEAKTISAPEPALVIEEEKGLEKEKIVVGIEEIKDIVSSQIGNKANIEKFDILEVSDGLQISAELNAGLLGGKISITGTIGNAGNEIAIHNLDIQARGYVKSLIEDNLSNFAPTIKDYFKGQNGESVSRMQIVGPNLEIEFENNPPLKSESPISESASNAESLSPAIEEKIPEWKKSNEWQDFERSRIGRAKAEINRRNLFKYGADPNKSIIKTVSNEKVEEVDAEVKDREFIYNEQKNIIAKKIEEALRAEAGQNLTPQQEAELNSKINGTVFEELVKKENDAYLQTIKEARGETWKDKVKIETAKVLSNKVVRWYLGLSKRQRMALSFGVGSIAGLAMGATVAPGMIGLGSYIAWRAARFGLSGTAGMKAGEWANKRWSVEELQKAEEKEMEDLKNSDIPLEEKSKGYSDIEKRYKKEKIKIALKKMGTTIGAGAGTGLLTGLAEHAVMGIGGATRSAVESKAGNATEIPKDRIWTRNGWKPTVKSQPLEPLQSSRPDLITETPKASSIPETSVPEQPTDVQIPNPALPKEAVVPPLVEIETPPVEKIFANPEILIHEVKAGDSAWSILKETLGNNEQFKGLTEAQKTYVLSALTNKMLKNPEDYGIGKNGVIHIGNKINSSKLFDDAKEVKSIFDKARQTIAPGSLQEKSILAHNEKIAEWVKAHSNESLSEEKVSEILSDKPKTEAVPGTKSEIPEIKPAPEPKTSPQLHNWIPQEDLNPDSPQRLSKSFKMADADMDQLHREIQAAKNRLTELEGGDKNPNLERSPASDSRAYALGAPNREIDEAFNNEIDSIYREKSLWGAGTAGIETKAWKEMARLPAAKIVEYYTGDSSRSGLPIDVTERLLKTKNHVKFMNQVVGLMEQANGAVKPFENENVEQFMKRLGGYVLRTHLQKAA